MRVEYRVGHLVDHPKFGIGKIIRIEGESVGVFFKSQEGPKTISTSKFPLKIAASQSDPWLDSLDAGAIVSAKAGKYLSAHAARAKFTRLFPLGFADPEFAKQERDYKWAAHELWSNTLNKTDYESLLAATDYREIADRALRIESRINLLASFEKAAFREAIKEPDHTANFANGLFDLIYGSDAYQLRFTRFVAVLDSLPQPRTELKWTICTLFPFLAMPSEHMFLKPVVTQEAARRRGFNLNYQPRPNWLTYECLLKFVNLLKSDLADFSPRDMIDIQSFIWITGEGSYS
jgi:hypothetical protein